MQVKDAMTRDPELIRPDATLQEAAETMRQLNVGSLPVCDGERLVGMLTDRDVTVRGTAEGVNPWETRVEVVMTSGVVYCFEDQDVAEAARIMRENGLRRLPVLSQEKRLVGIISLDDLAVDAGDERLAGEVVRGAAQPTQRKQ